MCKSNTIREEAAENTWQGGKHGKNQGIMLHQNVMKKS